MKKIFKMRYLLISTLLFLTVGFSAMNINLIISGIVPLAAEFNEIDVYFSNLKIDDNDVTVTNVKDNGRSFSFKTELDSDKTSQEVDFSLSNNSLDYDTIVHLNCSPDDSSSILLELTNEDVSLEAQSIKNNKLTVSLISGSSNEEISCSIEVSAVGRTSKAVEKDLCMFEEGTMWNYDYKGDVQQFMAPCKGTYKIEAWGASGGYSKCNDILKCSTPGKGAYTSGEIDLIQTNILYAYVGSKGADAALGVDSVGGYNGGGLGTQDKGDSIYSQSEVSGGGGGATDIRLESGAWNKFSGLKSRIMVAGGGSGASWEMPAGSAGGLESYSVNPNAKIATQDDGYAFGYGQDGYGRGKDDDGVAGGGGGYYGGGTSDTYGSTYAESGAGGSSYISGHDGCLAIDEESTVDNIIHKSSSNHYSQFVFDKTKMIDGEGYVWTNQKGAKDGMPSYQSDDTIFGNLGDGHVRITLVKKNK